MHRRAEDDTNAAGASVLEEAEKVDLVGALAQRGEDYAAPDLKPRPVGRVHEAAIFFIEVRAAGGAKVDAEKQRRAKKFLRHRRTGPNGNRTRDLLHPKEESYH